MSFAEIAQKLDPVTPSRSMRELLKQHYSSPPANSFADINSRHEHREHTAHRFMVFNTYLMDVAWGAGEKPAVDHRDSEIGEFTANNFDIVCLNEVWHQEEREDLHDEWPNETDMDHKSGVKRSRGRRALRGIFSIGLSEIGETQLGQMGNSAGLVNLSQSLNSIGSQFHEFEFETGQDANAAKGCLLSIYETGFSSARVPSSLLIYNTHLNAEGEAKLYQVLELANFIWQTKDRPQGDRGQPNQPGLNGFILAGDFNIDRHSRNLINIDDFLSARLLLPHSGAESDVLRGPREGLANKIQEYPAPILRAVQYRITSDGRITNTRARQKTAYQILKDVMSVLGLQDHWVNRNNTLGYTSGFTSPEVARIVAQPDRDDRRYCEDDIDLAAVNRLPTTPKAIDYIFVSPTTRNMDFTMDFTRPRRPYTAREPGATDYDEMAWLSDHLGISTKILLAPKPTDT